MQQDCKDRLSGAGGTLSADHKISFLRHKPVRKRKIWNREIRKTESIFTISTEKMKMGIIRIGTGAVGRTKCVLGTIAGIVDPMDQSLLFKSFQGSVERCSVRPGKMSFKEIETHCRLLINQKLQHKQPHGCGLNISGSKFFNERLFVHFSMLI